MSKVFSRWAKRSQKTITVAGEPMHIRSMTVGELRTLDTLEDDARTGFAIGCSVVDETGKSLCPKNDGEENSVYAGRVLEECGELPVETLKEIADAIMAMAKVPAAASLEKN